MEWVSPLAVRAALTSTTIPRNCLVCKRVCSPEDLKKSVAECIEIHVNMGLQFRDKMDLFVEKKIPLIVFGKIRSLQIF